MAAVQELILSSRRCRICGEGGRVIFRAVSSRQEESAEALCDALCSLGAEDFTLFDIPVEDWESELSPWAAEAGGESFSGGGGETLRFLLDEALPYASEHRCVTGRYLCGYSLSALFALWAFYESGVFDGVGCCSGSLWFPGWADYAAAHSAPSGSAVYLSLGGKEPGRGRPPMNSIGEEYECQTKLCRADGGIARFRMEMNPGGHFSDPTLRVAKGVRWLLG